MKFKPSNNAIERARRRARAFTLAEVLAALVFMAIVIPVTVQALRVASFAGQVGDRRTVATRVAERVLNEYVVTGLAAGGAQNGVIEEGARSFRWTLQTEPWNSGSLNLVSVRVAFDVQGEEYDVWLSTLMNESSTTTSSTTTL
jgi:type II secretory pathway pseudopilin PulG